MLTKNISSEQEAIKELQQNPAQSYLKYKLFDKFFNQEFRHKHRIKTIENENKSLLEQAGNYVIMFDFLVLSLLYIMMKPTVLFNMSDPVIENTGIQTIHKQNIYKNTIRITLQLNGKFSVIGQKNKLILKGNTFSSLSKAIEKLTPALIKEQSQTNKTTRKNKLGAIIMYERGLPTDYMDDLIRLLGDFGIEKFGRYTLK